MKTISAALIVTLYMIGMHVLSVDGPYIDETVKRLDICSFEEVSKTSVEYSVYIEHVTKDPLLLHVSEPIRFSFLTRTPESEVERIMGTWVTVHILRDASICMVPDHEKTETMRRRSDYLQEKLRTRIHE